MSSITLPSGINVSDNIDLPSGTDMLSEIDLPSDLMRPSSGQEFVYDANGNRTSSSVVYYTIASTSNRVKGTNALAPNTFVQDGAGNTTKYSSSTWGSVIYNYDAFNRMSGVTTNGNLSVCYTAENADEITYDMAGEGRPDRLDSKGAVQRATPLEIGR